MWDHYAMVSFNARFRTSIPPKETDTSGGIDNVIQNITAVG